MTDPRLERWGQSVLYLVCPAPGCRFEGDVYYDTCPPTYCSNACKQKAYRERKRVKPVTNNLNESVTGLDKEVIEKDIDMTLHIMRCPECGRAIWTVWGNVQIGGLECGVCKREFVKCRDR